jgi:hypothetical protein
MVLLSLAVPRRLLSLACALSPGETFSEPPIFKFSDSPNLIMVFCTEHSRVTKSSLPGCMCRGVGEEMAYFLLTFALCG